MTRCGLFVGLITLDLVYLVEAPPAPNQKIVAVDYTIAAGGPATNAAIAFQYLNRQENHQDSGSQARLLGTLGRHPLSRLVQSDLEQWGVTSIDLHPDQAESPPTSSILVTQATGDRAVVSLNAVKTQAAIDRLSADILSEVGVVLIDGHQMAMSEEIARQAKAAQIPIVVDAGSWKPGFESVLSLADYVICSANFYPPGCKTSSEVLTELTALGISHIAVSQGDRPIQYLSAGHWGEIAIPQITPVDTLGAGDILHGAFCYYILQDEFTGALAKAAIVASQSCQSFGTRSWMTSTSDR